MILYIHLLYGKFLHSVALRVEKEKLQMPCPMPGSTRKYHCLKYYKSYHAKVLSTNIILYTN